MRLVLVVSSLLAASSSVSAFAPSSRGVWSGASALQSTVEAVSADEINSRMEANISKMSAKDATSTSLSKEVSQAKEIEETRTKLWRSRVKVFSERIQNYFLSLFRLTSQLMDNISAHKVLKYSENLVTETDDKRLSNRLDGRKLTSVNQVS